MQKWRLNLARASGVLILVLMVVLVNYYIKYDTLPVEYLIIGIIGLTLILCVLTSYILRTIKKDIKEKIRGRNG